MKALATDLDGTLIPFDFTSRDGDELELCETDSKASSSTPLSLQLVALERITLHHARGGFLLIYVTGRDEPSALRCIREEQLPEPEYLFCDVGTTLLRRVYDSSTESPLCERYERVNSYQEAMNKLVSGVRASDLGDFLGGMKRVELQELHKQGEFKRSYYCVNEDLESASIELLRRLEASRLPYQVTSSTDPFTGDGLIDLLPQGVNKGFAVRWWSAEYRIAWEDLVYAGDSGNDLAAFTSGVRSIIVGNASRDLVRTVLEHHRLSNTLDMVHISKHYATSGVLEGCQQFGLINSECEL